MDSVATAVKMDGKGFLVTKNVELGHGDPIVQRCVATVLKKKYVKTLMVSV